MTSGAALVTGGAGFIGSVLCRRLVEEGREVLAYDDLSYGREELLAPHPRLRLVRGDVRDGAALASLLREHRPEAVFHLAALHFIPYCNAHPAEALDVNLGGTRALLRACRERPPRVLVFASTAAVYPRDGSPFAEDVPLAPLDVYGHSKASGEDLVRLFGADSGVAVAAARLFNAFGPGDTNPHLVPEVVQQLRGTPGHPSLRLGNLEPVRDYVHVRDVAAALHGLASEARGVDVWNVGSGEGRSVRDVVDAFSVALGVPIAIEVDPERVRAVDRLKLVADSAKLRARTGWAPRVPFEDGLRELVEDLRRRRPPAAPRS